MRAGWCGAGIALVVMMLTVLHWAGGPSAGQAPAAQARVRWEYKTLDHVGPGRPADKTLNKLGDEGWELVSVAAPSSRQELIYVFKRQKQK
ncbi:MAG: DUF4177 domain-containing protein [Planctomycetes bacterium]|nr:DUF4177 domain-containing protein [Planctomycetota bacterium]